MELWPLALQALGFPLASVAITNVLSCTQVLLETVVLQHIHIGDSENMQRVLRKNVMRKDRRQDSPCSTVSLFIPFSSYPHLLMPAPPVASPWFCTLFMQTQWFRILPTARLILPGSDACSC